MKSTELCIRVSAHQAGAETISVLTIASSLETDSGNYTCSLPHSDLAQTTEIVIQQARTRVGASENVVYIYLYLYLCL